MAGRGPAPKSPEQRRRRNVPERGEWVDLSPLEKPVLGVADRAWSAEAREMWVAWRQDPVTGTYSPADKAAIRALARNWDECMPSEQRLRMDGLGLTPKGKRDLRLRVTGVAAPAAGAPTAEVRRLRAV